MAVRVHCPACRAGVMVLNARYRVFLHCHECGREFMANGGDSADEWELLETDEPEQPASEPDDWLSREPEPGSAVLVFCPMCGELAPELADACPACGEPLPADPPAPAVELDPQPVETRRFRRRARWLGLLWIWLAYSVAFHDIWVGGQELAIPRLLLARNIVIPEIPLLATGLICLAAFALAGQFWAIAAGGFLNYLVLFLVVWTANPLSVGLLAASIFLTHWTLLYPPAARTQ